VPSLEARHGGPSRSVRGLSEGLAGCEHQVSLLTTGPLEQTIPDIDGFLTTRAFPRMRPANLAPSRGLREHLLGRRFDVIHHHGLWQRTLHYAHTAARDSSIPLVLSPRGMMSPW